jgi:hypothetical protein
MSALRALSAEEAGILRRTNMIYIKVQYDAYNRTFKLVDKSLGRILEDEGLYDLAIPFILEDAADQDCFTSIDATMAHA